MTTTAKTLIESKYISNAQTTEYTAPPGIRTIIDKYTATNTDSGSQTVSINLVPAGGAADNTNLIVKAKSLSAGDTYDFVEIKNHILNPGDIISVIGSVASKLVQRGSGREVS